MQPRWVPAEPDAAPATPPVTTPAPPQWVPAEPDPVPTPTAVQAQPQWVPAEDDGWRPGAESKDLVEFDDHGKAIYYSKTTGQPSDKPQGFYPKGKGPMDQAQPPQVAHVMANTPPPSEGGKPPTPAPLPSKSGLDQAVGTIGKGAYNFGRGLMAPVMGAAKGVATIADPLIALVQAEFGGPSIESLKGTPYEVNDPFYKIYHGLVTTALQNPTDLLGGSAQRLRTEGTEALTDPAWWGEAAADTASNILFVPGVARVLGMAKTATLPTKVNRAVDTAIGKVIPKYNWGDDMLGVEGANVGTKMLKGHEMTDLLKTIQDIPMTGPATPLQTLKFQAASAQVWQNTIDLVTSGAATLEQVSNRIKMIAAKPGVLPHMKVGEILELQLSLATNHKLLDSMGNMIARDGRPLMMTHPAPLQGQSPYGVAGVPAPQGYVQIPRHADLLGNYRGAWVHEDVADVLPTLARSAESESLFRQYMLLWKKAKTIFNPSTHLNNALGNVLFATFAGNNPFNPANLKFYRQASKEVTAYLKDPNSASTMLREAMEDGAVRPGFANIELRMAKDRLQESTSLIAKGNDRAHNWYEREDLVSRYSTYIKNRTKMARREAGIETNKYFPGYSSTSQFGQWLRTSNMGAPFTSFPLESARIYATAAKEAPWRAAGAGALFQGMIIQNLADMNMTLEDWYEYKRGLPRHMANRTLVPYKNMTTGGMEVADMTSMVPLGDLFGAGDSPADAGAARSTLFGGPAWDTFKLVANYDWYMNRPIYDTNKGETFKDEGLNYLAKTWTPLPSFAQQAFKRVPNALDELPPRRHAEPENPLNAAWYSLFPSMDARTEEELGMQSGIQTKGGTGALKRGMRSMQADPTTSEDVKERRRGNILDELLRRSR